MKNKKLMQETSSASRNLLSSLLSLTWDSRRFNLPGEDGKLLAAVASWKRVQHLEVAEPPALSYLADEGELTARESPGQSSTPEPHARAVPVPAGDGRLKDSLKDNTKKWMLPLLHHAID
jgi:hypothetical protein